MNTKTMFTIVALMAAIGMLGMAAAHVAIPTVPPAMAQGNNNNQGQDNNNQGNDNTGNNKQGNDDRQ